MLQEYQKGDCIWSWCSYWEIYQGDKLIADANDDITAVTGTVAVAAMMMEGKCLEGCCIDDEDLSMELYFEDDIVYVIWPEKRDDEYLSNWVVCSERLNVSYKMKNDLEIIQTIYY